MNILWNYLKSKNINTQKANIFFLLINTLIAGIGGFFIWFIIHFFTLNKIAWALCFIGYPGFFIGLLGGILFLYKQ